MDGLSIRNMSGSVNQADGLQTRTINKSQNENNSVSDLSDSFAGTLNKAIKSVDSLQKEADLKMQKLATGQETDIHGTMIAAEKAEIALKFMVQVRNKIIDAYHEIMKMQV